MRLASAFSTTSPLPLVHSPLGQTNIHSFPFLSYPFRFFPNKSSSVALAAAKKRNTQSGPVLRPTILEEKQEVYLDKEEDKLTPDDFEDEELMDDDDDDEYIEDEYEADEAELYAGDGVGGGGIKLAGTLWDKQVLAIAEDVCTSNGDLRLYAFKTLANFTIQVRIEKLSNKSGSPSMADIEVFSSIYRARLDEAELAGLIPNNISLEVSSPGVERVVRIPQDLDRFKDRPMYVRYVDEEAVSDSSAESDGIFRLVSYDLETECCIWGIADVRLNREKAGKGRPLNKKQRDWRLNTPFDSLRLVRLYSDI